MKRMHLPALLAALLLTTSFATTAMAAPDGRPGPSERDGWAIDIAPYLFLPINSSGTSTVSGQDTDLDLSLSDLFEHFSVLSLSLRGEAWRNDWGIIVDILWTELDGDFGTQFGPTGARVANVNAETEQTTVDFAVAYRALTESVWDGRTLGIDLIGGLRYATLQQTVDLDLGAGLVPGQGGTENWLEPMLGARAALSLSDIWTLAVRGDVSGFGIGTASDLTWNLLAGFDYLASESVSLRFGWRLYGIDYSRGGGSDRFAYDMFMHGPYLAAAFYL